MTDINTFVKAGKDMGLTGQDLQDFVKEQQKQQQDIDRENRALEREKMKSAEKIADEDRQLKEKIEGEKMKIEQQKLELEKQRVENKKTEVQSVSLNKLKLQPFKPESTKFDAYISRFESVAEMKKWRRSEWALQLSILLEGESLDVFYGLSDEDQRDYDALKEALLRKYQFTEEHLRKKFYSTKPDGDETPTQFMSKIERLFNKWVDMTKITKTYEELRSLVVREQFLRRCHGDLAAYLREKKLTDKVELAKTAERYIDAHGGYMTEKTKVKKPEDKKISQEAEQKTNSKKPFKKKDDRKCAYCKRDGHLEEKCWEKHGKPDNVNLSTDTNKRCFSCNQVGHISKNCPSSKQDHASACVEHNDDKGTACSCIQSHKASACISDVIGDFVEENATPQVIEQEGVKYVIHSDRCQKPIHVCGCVKLEMSKGKVNGKEVEVMMDSGCTSAVVKVDFVKPYQYANTWRICKLIDGTMRKFPLAWIDVECDHIVGEVEALVMETPVSELIIGNTVRCRMTKDGITTEEVKKIAKNDDSNFEDTKVVTTTHEDNEEHNGEPSIRKAPLEKNDDAVTDKTNIDVKSKNETTPIETDRTFKEIEQHSYGITTKGEQDEDDDDEDIPLDLLDTDDEDSNEIEETGISAAMTRAQHAAEKKKPTPLIVPTPETVEKEVLKENQQRDISLKKYWSLAETQLKRETKSAHIHFEMKNGILYRYFTVVMYKYISENFV